MPFYCGLPGLIRRCLMPLAWYSWSNTWFPLGLCSLARVNRSVKAFTVVCKIAEEVPFLPAADKFYR